MALLGQSHQRSKVVSIQLIVLLAERITPAVRAKVTRRARTSHQAIHTYPGGGLSATLLLGIELGSPIGKHSLGSVRASLGSTARSRRERGDGVCIVEGKVHFQLLASTERLALSHELSLYY